MVRKSSKTRKSKASPPSQEKGMTIPQLRRAFEHIDRWVKGHNGDVEGFQKEWKKTFGKEVSKDAAKDYLQFVHKQKGGGQVMTPAPLGYDLRAGAETPYGSFPEYVTGGFGFANMDSVSLGCGKESITPSIPSGMGSNLVGGRRVRKTRRRGKQTGGALPSLSTAVSEFLSRPFGMSSPPSTTQDTQMISKGYNGFPSPRPEINDLNFVQNPPIYNANIAPTSRAF